ncbi:TetR/AcrR family transcriptional regulator [Nocardia cyriacigeorgica]|uniref:TetR/AcrR family transcriptional regulator n=1 Tax=Nocardia cyriacigeorgica TaxID=135487 RepID=A0A5R8P749_9NOCA|nr:TetR/AcrR family transcriptional regulator [Nocardia cyriacigeorgica]TLF98295.1 TetR/AcrR family transcriptional regulator [Nocardia cyriacigeorgica]
MSTATSRGPRGPYARSTERRRVIAAAVLGLVEEKGHEHLTTAEVAARADLAEATVLYHFPSRDHLLVAALEHSEEQATTLIPPIGSAAADLPDRLREFVHQTTQHSNVTRLFMTLAAQATLPGHPARDYITRHRSRVVEVFTELVRARQHAGMAHPGLDPAVVARQFVATWTGLETAWFLDPSFDLADLVVDAFRRLTGQNWAEIRAMLLDPSTGL